MGMSKDQQSFRNMSLSFRGTERQPPSVLQMALRFSVVIDRQASSVSGNTEARLKKVVQQFNESPGLHVKHQIDAEKERTILNLIVGTSKVPGCPKMLGWEALSNCWAGKPFQNVGLGSLFKMLGWEALSILWAGKPFQYFGLGSPFTALGWEALSKCGFI